MAVVVAAVAVLAEAAVALWDQPIMAVVAVAVADLVMQEVVPEVITRFGSLIQIRPLYAGIRRQEPYMLKVGMALAVWLQVEQAVGLALELPESVLMGVMEVAAPTQPMEVVVHAAPLMVARQVRTGATVAQEVLA